MEKWLKSVRFMIVKSSFKAVALSSFLAAAFLCFSPFSFAYCDFDTLGNTITHPSVFSVRDVRTYTDMDMGAAAISSAIGASNVDLIPSIAGTAGTLALLDYIRQPVQDFTSGYTYSDFSLSDIVNRQTIKIRRDVVTIDGVDYSDVWLPHDAAFKFRVNAFDFITAYNIVSNSSATFATGAGFLNGCPIYQVGSSYVTQSILFTDYSQGGLLGNFTYRTTRNGSNYIIQRRDESVGSSFSNISGNRTGSTYCRFQTSSSSNPLVMRGGYSSDGSSFVLWSTDSSTYTAISDQFDFSYVSGVIDATPLPEEYGLSMRIPSSSLSGVPDVISSDLPDYDEYLRTVGAGFTSASVDGTLQQSVFESFDTPVPPVPVENTIADEPYSSLSGALNGIQSVISSISTSVSGIADSIVGADSSFFGNVVSALAVPFEPVFAIFRSGVGIWRYVVSWVGTISSPFLWSLSALGSAGNYFLSPIYAAAAAAVVLAVYKKFGR